MTDEQPPLIRPVVPLGWWLLWLVIVSLASVVPYMHWHWKVAEAIEPLRYSWGLLPAHWLFFRWSGEIAAYALILVLIAGFLAWRQPRIFRIVISLAAVIALVSAVASASLCGRLLISQIEHETRMTHDERLRHYMGLSPAEPTPKQNPQK